MSGRSYLSKPRKKTLPVNPGPSSLKLLSLSWKRSSLKNLKAWMKRGIVPGLPGHYQQPAAKLLHPKPAPGPGAFT
jgi:hypothetical protein